MPGIRRQEFSEVTSAFRQELIVKVAVISTQGNIFAPEAVLEDSAKQHVDLTVNPGDILSGG
ncbi:hypothetical protein AUN14_14935 [Cronobacter muytjensii]|uniref:Uncharacterized protein n=1 Tax=Cronobacter muytjensii TaxID=413501 RepID=A0A2T7AQT9_9ENTR|nr:hypothetical protein AUN14_14935 [Cronobacter muytjensii]